MTSPAVTTSRFLFPEDRLSFVYSKPGSPIITPPRTGLQIFTNAQCTILADIEDINSAPVPYSTLYTGADSLIPEFYGPAGFVRYLFARVLGHTTSYRLDARYADQLANVPLLSSGDGPPSESVGAVGSFYFDRGISTTVNVDDNPKLYGPRTLAGWPSTGFSLRGPQGIAGSSFIWIQSIADTTWTMDHPLPYHPAVTLLDSNDEKFEGSLTYPFVGRVVAQIGAPETGRGIMT